MSRRCAACGEHFTPFPQVPDQTYCSDPECQRERRRRWQREKQRTDPDYWQQYRKENPCYVERNRERQRTRNEKQRLAKIVKMDVSPLPLLPPSGRYRLIPVSDNEIAKSDEWIIEITVLSSPFRPIRDDCKDMT